MRPRPSVSLALLLLTAMARAEVVAAGAHGFISEHEVLLAAPPARAYAALTEEVAAWWDPAHSHSGEAANFTLDAGAGGCFCEKLANGGTVMHMQVVFADPGRLLRLVGGLGPLQGMGISGSMDFALEAHGDNGTRLRYRYVVSGYAPEGLEALAEPVDRVQLGQLERLRTYLNSR
jgi:uncharacterized protein YndB with AHSA1/START domain